MKAPVRAVTPRHGFGDPHELEPRRGAHLLKFCPLLGILVGDVVAFYQLAARAMPDAEAWVVWALVCALSLAATVSMHQAGGAARARRAGSRHHPGRLWSSVLVHTWLGLGGVSMWFRMAADGAAPVTQGFGTGLDSGAATHLPLAALLLMLYLVGGTTAYGIGFTTHNPARSAYLRARRAHRRAERAYRWAVWRRDRVDRVPRTWRFRIRPRLRTSAPIETSVDAGPLKACADASCPEAAGDYQVRSRTLGQETGHSSKHFTVVQLSERRHRAEVRARAQADQLRQVARHRLAVALGEPASSSGVFVPPAAALASASSPYGVDES